jgi:NitT/TauT family transport system substrate-binding protein
MRNEASGMIDRRRMLLGAAAGAICGPVLAQQPSLIRINTFPNATNLALFIGDANGVFAQRGLKLDVEFTQNSEDQRRKLGAGEVDIAYSAIDNAVAMVELAKQDVVILSGGDTSMMELMVRPEIVRLEDLRGRTLVVDRSNTAYALQAKKILKNAGLLPGRDYAMKEVGATVARIAAMESGADGVAAGMLNPPFSFGAKDKGMKSFGRAVDLIGPYQGGGFFALRTWPAANGALLERFFAAYIVATRMALDPANRTQSIELIASRLKQAPALATRTYDEALLQPRFGLVRDARLDVDGLKTVLMLRAEFEGQWNGVAPPAERYIDLGYYERALKSLDSK